MKLNKLLTLVKTNYVMFMAFQIVFLIFKISNNLKISTSDVIYFDFVGNKKNYRLKK